MIDIRYHEHFLQTIIACLFDIYIITLIKDHH